jgi:iron complex transport system ATP-binding protein
MSEPAAIPLIDAHGLGFSYGVAPLFTGVTFQIGAGELVGLCGPNGAGKSTLLRLLLGLLQPRAGTVCLHGRAVETLGRRDVARLAALLLQETVIELPLSVREVVAMGRLPHLGRFQPEGPSDVEAVEAAMAVTDTLALAERSVMELSGGERHRVHLARAVAQGAPVLMLDEPTASLDLVHQLQAMQLLRTTVAEGKCALVAVHDLSLAARSCDRILLLAGGGLVADAPPAEVLTVENLARHFHVRAEVRTDGAGRPVVIPLAPLGAG